jgi:hypothetical protein
VIATDDRKQTCRIPTTAGSGRGRIGQTGDSPLLVPRVRARRSVRNHGYRMGDSCFGDQTEQLAVLLDFTFSTSEG